jgi:hypothetical protein
MVARKRTAEPSVQPPSNDESGSTGRNTTPENLGRDKDSGQERYGQSGHGGETDIETVGKPGNRRSSPDGEGGSKTESNEGSGLVEHERAEYEGGKAPDSSSVNSRPRDLGRP